MLKVAVFDCGWGGELIGDYIEDELPVEVVRIIDYQNAPYSEKTDTEIRMLTEMALATKIGKVEVIVLANTAISLATLDYLSKKYPEQKFVGYGNGLADVLQRTKRAMILTTKEVRRTEKYQIEKAKCQDVEILELDCDGWDEFIDEGLMSKELVAPEVEWFDDGAVILYDSVLLDIEDDLRQIFRWRAEIMDVKKFLLRDLCIALGLKGRDGRLPRERLR